MNILQKYSDNKRPDVIYSVLYRIAFHRSSKKQVAPDLKKILEMQAACGKSVIFLFLPIENALKRPLDMSNN